MATDGVDPLDDLLSELRAEGEVDSRGSFTLDRKQARAKLQKFQLADPRRYVLELVQAAVLRGATRIDFEIDADDMHMRFDGRAFTPAELDDLWGSIFADGEDEHLRGLRQLALGLNAALGMAPKRIRVVSGTSSIELRPDRDDVLEQRRDALAQTHVHVEQRLKLGLVVDFLRNLTGTLSEEVYLQHRCAYSPIPITLDGKPLAQGLRLDDALATTTLELPDVAATGMIAWRTSEQPAELRLVKDGVWIDSHPLERVGPGFVAVVASTRLRKDVSLAKIVADETLSQLIGLIRIERWRVLAQVVDRIDRQEIASAPAMDRIRREALEHLKGRLLRKRPESEVARLAAKIVFREARTHEGVRFVSLLDIMAAIEASPLLEGKPTLRHTYIIYPQLAPEGHAIPQLSKEMAQSLGRMFAATPVRVDEELDAASMREINRRAWRMRTVAASLPAHRTYVARTPLAAAGVRGELGIRRDAEPLGKMWVLLDGCELGQLERDFGVAGLDIVVEADFTPSERFDAAQPDVALARALLHVFVALGPLLVELSRVAPQPERVLAWLSLLVDARMRRTFLWERLGVSEAEHTRAEQAGILPTPAQIRAGEGALALALDSLIFTDCDGTPRSLRVLLERCDAAGSLAMLPRASTPEPELGAEVAWLDERQYWILAAIVGEAKLRSVADAHQQRRNEKAFWAKHALLPDTYAASLRSALGQVDTALWIRALPGGKGMIALAHDSELAARDEPSPLRCATIELVLQGRALVERKFDIGIGPIRGFVDVEAQGLAAAPGLADVVDDAALAGLVELLREEAWSLVAGLLARHDQLYGARRWFVTLLLTQLVQPGGEHVALRLPTLPTIPSVQTLDGGAISLVEVDQIVKDYGQIEWVPASTLGAGIRNPPIVRDEAPIIAVLRKLVGKALIDGEPRVRRHAISTKLEAMPRIERAKLDPATVLHVQSIGGGNPPITGEVGLSRTRVEGGLELQLCTLGRRVAILQAPELPVALAAIVDDPELQLRSDGTVDVTSKQCSGHVRRCRRAIPGLILALCKRFEHLHESERAHARALLLRYVGNEAIAGPGRREHREQAWEAARALPLAEDLWGRHHSLASLETRARKRRNRLDVVSKPVPLPAGVEPGDRVIVIADAPLHACLRQLVEQLHDIEAEWEAERAALVELGHAPALSLPDPRHVAWVDRKSSVAGGLEVHLWIAHTPSPDDRVVCARGDREVGRLEVLPGVAMQGVLRGEGLVLEGGQVRLDGRQRASLAKQACGLLDALARQVQRGGKLDANAREQALVYLIGVEAALARLDPKLAESIGKPFAALRETLDGMIAPALRRAHARAREEAETVHQPASTPTPTLTPSEPKPPEPKPSESKPSEPRTPEVVLLTLVRAELEWIQRRHGSVIERLGLDRLMVGPGSKVIVSFERGIVLHAGHPLIARMLAALAQGREIDPIDLTFAVAVIVGVMNRQAEEIGAKDERAYLDQLAQSLRLALG